MAQTILVVPTGPRVGLTTVAVGLVHALDRRGVRVGFCKPIAQPHEGDTGPERSSRLVELVAGFTPPPPLSAAEAADFYAHRQRDRLFEEVVARVEAAASRADVIIVEGLVPSPEQPYTAALNAGLASSLDAKVVLVAAPNGSPTELSDALELAAQDFGGVSGGRVVGCILNQVGAPPGAHSLMRLEATAAAPTDYRAETPVLRRGDIRLLGTIPWEGNLLAPRVADVAAFLGAETVYQGDLNRRVTDVALGASTVTNAAQRLLPGTLFITSGDREDLVLAAAMAALSGRPIAALLLTNGRRPGAPMLELCEPGLATGLTLLLVPDDSFQAALRVREMNLEVPLDDPERIELLSERVAEGLAVETLEDLTRTSSKTRRLSPPAFRHLLVERARAADKRIVLPEGSEPRTLQAACICAERGVARCVLLGDPGEIQSAAARAGLSLPAGLELLSPAEHVERFVEPSLNSENTRVSTYRWRKRRCKTT